MRNDPLRHKQLASIISRIVENTGIKDRQLIEAIYHDVIALVRKNLMLGKNSYIPMFGTIKLTRNDDKTKATIINLRGKDVLNGFTYDRQTYIRFRKYKNPS